MIYFFVKRVKTYSILIFSMYMLSCQNNFRRLYISNKTGRTLTLYADPALRAKQGTMQAEFKAALDRKRIWPGHVIIGFGKGKWSKSDEKCLSYFLQHVTISNDRNGKIFKLPNNPVIGHGVLIQELIVTINELE